MKPVLVALDIHTRTARRYFPKPSGGFIVQEAVICDQPDDIAAQVESFRTGRLEIEDQPATPTPEVA